jgi:hypothetical protein
MPVPGMQFQLFWLQLSEIKRNTSFFMSVFLSIIRGSPYENRIKLMTALTRQRGNVNAAT